MAAGIFDSEIRKSGRGSALGFWVAIELSIVTSFIQQIEHGGRDSARSLPAIFAHPDERPPVPWPHQREKHEAQQLKLSVGRDKAIEIRKLVAVSVADALDAIKRNAAHPGEACDGRGLHVDEGGPLRPRRRRQSTRRRRSSSARDRRRWSARAASRESAASVRRASRR